VEWKENVAFTFELGQEIVLEFESDHFNEVFYKLKLENFLVDNSEYQLQFWVDLPAQRIILVSVFHLFSGVFVLQKHRFHELVDQLNVARAQLLRKERMRPE
jgi:hypothetical protein